MSEYWVSNKKYYCKYCKIYITDNKISRQNHDNGRKHKEIVQMYIRDVQKRKQEEDKEAEATRRMLQQVEKAAYKQYSQDCINDSKLSTKDLKVNFSYYNPETKDTEEYVNKKDTEEKKKKEDHKPIIDKNTGIGQWEVVEPEESVEDPPALLFKDENNKEEDGNVFHAKESSYNSSIQVVYEEEKDIDNLKNFKIEEKKLIIDDETSNDDKPIQFKKRKTSRKDKKKNARIKLE
ncbi:hypothetical protein BCR36DRAFT_18833 [Piromyces finnis]|uniref:Matrin-type domain-containing protein n=1 Tax=Piromyces finnis TaxID=1754191 RepID=A0A1Y1UL55_9FUNG|nr:hypothetical protein BCR36DRAFT_18833 [Piromyces finnis]|eukprot:ORX38793.1 hypothetical protein BCR36DRAFT_18833 [Piromyces finnis]